LDFEIVLFAFDPAVDVQVELREQTVGLAVETGFNVGGFVGMIEKCDLLTDESDGSLEETTRNSDGTVFGDGASVCGGAAGKGALAAGEQPGAWAALVARVKASGAHQVGPELRRATGRRFF
jgi:hypothetical protein